MKYLALLRGINVGGNNIIKKDELKACFESAGLESVLTYIQSGNILFKSSETNKEKISKQIQSELSKKLKKQIPVVIYCEEEYLNMLKRAHNSWGHEQKEKHNALFLINQMTEKEAKVIFPRIKEEYETVSFAKGVVFWSGSKEHFSKTSYAQEIVKSPIYKQVTIRNSNTSLKLKELFDQI